MKKNLIITHSRKIAILIATTFDGIIDSDNNTIYKYESINKNMNNIKALSDVGFLKTRMNGQSTVITWIDPDCLISDIDYKASKELKTDDSLPVNINYEKYLLNKTAFNKLIEFKGFSSVYFAFYPTVETDLQMLVIRDKILRAESFYAVRLQGLHKDAIEKAFNNPLSNVNINGLIDAAQTRHLVSSQIAINLNHAFEKYHSFSLGINQYTLLCLYLLLQRNSHLGDDMYNIQASINVKGNNCTALSNFKYSLHEAKEIVNDLKTEVKANGFVPAGLPVTSSLFLNFNPQHKKSCVQLAKSLFEKKYISQPFTSCNQLSPYITTSIIKQSWDAALDNATMKDTVPDKSTAYNILESLKRKKPSPEHTYALIPLYSNESLSPAETELYKSISRALLHAISDNEHPRYMFSVDDYNFFLRLPDYKWREMIRPGTLFPVVYDVVRSESFKPYTPYSLVHELEEKHIAKPSLYYDIIISLFNADLVVLENEELHLSSRGVDLCSALMDKDTAKDVQKWEALLLKGENGESSAYDELFDSVNEQVSSWVAKIKKMDITTRFTTPVIVKDISIEIFPNAEQDSKQDSDVLKQAAYTSAAEDGLKCPNCNRNTLYQNGTTFVCSECGLTLNNRYEIDGHLILLNKKDINSLIDNGRTSLRFSTDKEVAGFITLDQESKMMFTNKSTQVCPYCGEPLYVYDWGFACNNCAFNVPFVIHNVKLSSTDLSKLIKGHKTGLINNLEFTNGQKLSAKLQIAEDGTLKYFK